MEDKTNGKLSARRAARSTRGETQLVHLIRQLQQEYGDRIVGVYRLPERESQFLPLTVDLLPELLQRVQEGGIQGFYSHQVHAMEAVKRGEHVVIVTGTASGKTLCYNLPVLDALLQDKRATALYLFPTKALAQDQMGKLLQFGFDPQVPVSTYDGDTPTPQRAMIRRSARILLSNPDMLHLSILPYHTDWSHFLRHLRYVVVDEIHTYRGIFGSHVAHILRRLRRLAEAYGSHPQFICTSATVGNPLQLAQTLTGCEMSLIEEDGSPRGERWLLFWLPPLLGPSGDRLSPNTETAHLIYELILCGVRHIAFVRSRVTSELVLRYVQEIIGKEAMGNPSLWSLVNRVSSYRAGYLPWERRQIERALFEGELLSVIATNALELGIDVGALEAVLLNGYPGNIASFWQQMGRAGRKHGEALAVFVLHNDPLHAYFAAHSEELLERPIERAHLNPHNPYVLSSHLMCAAHEKPLTEEDLSLFGVQPEDRVLQILEESGMLRKDGRLWFYMDRRSPAREINIRTAKMENYLVLDSDTGREIGTVEEERAFRTIHPQALYLHRGDSYQIIELDIERRQAWARQVEVDYYTQPMVEVLIDVLHVMEAKKGKRGWFKEGIVQVHEQVVGYLRKRLLSGELLGVEELQLPPRRFETTALWWHPITEYGSVEKWKDGGMEGVAGSRQQAAGNKEPKTSNFKPQTSNSESEIPLYPGMHALEHLTHSLLPVLTGCDPSDIGGTTQLLVPEAEPIAFFLYDVMPGGTGLAEAAFERAETLFALAHERLNACPCEEGCPACILLPSCVKQNTALDKAQAKWILETLIRV